MAWFLSKAALLAGPLGEQLFEWAFSRLESGVSLLRGVEEELEKLKRTVDRITCLLTDAEERRRIEDASVKLWLRQLKMVAFDADDLLDRYTTLLSLSKQNPNPSRKRKRSWLAISDAALLRRLGIAVQIAKIKGRFDEIDKGRKKLRLRAGDAVRRSQASQRSRPSPAAAAHESTPVIGRAKETAEIVGELTRNAGSALSVLSIYGAPGIGKTALARQVYDHPDVQKHFDRRIWVGLSDGCDVKSATEEIMEAVTRQKCDLLSLDILQHRLGDLLAEFKFLLVIDNLWAEDFQFWETLRCPLLAGKTGSKVLVTTRNERVWKMMAASHATGLKGLLDEDCWLLLRNKAFPKGDHSDHNILVEIGRQIAEKCQGSPTAAKSLGVLLSELGNEHDWTAILNEMKVLEEDRSGILPSIQISYHHLPYHLKLCFAYCSVFPSGYEFGKDEVIRLWMAEGLIPCIPRIRLEATGSRYFNELVWRSFIESSRSCPQPQRGTYRMPSLMHNLARLASEFVTLEPHLPHPEPENARYASFSITEKESPTFDEKISAYPHLRTFKLCVHQQADNWRPIQQEFFLRLSCLRVLDLSNSRLKELPDSVGDLIHLRYLSLSNTQIKRLPESVGGLYNLQTLELGKCRELQELPQDSVGNLINLRCLVVSGTRIERLPESLAGLSNLHTLELSDCYRLQELPRGTSKLGNLQHLGLHLDWDRVSSLSSMPPEIGRLTHLQTLSRFTVTSECDIRELKNLNLRGELCILNLEDVTCVEAAKEANLRGKQYIEDLMLRWGDAASISQLPRVNLCEQVIEHLRPYYKLKCLQIDNYPGCKLPDWMGDQSFMNLELVKLSYCRNCELLPLLGSLPRLKNLHIAGMHELRSMGKVAGFASLEILTLQDMPKLERLFECEEVEIPKLREVSILHCPDLHDLSLVATMLDKLEIRDCLKLCNLPVLPRLHDLAIERGNEQILQRIGCLSSLSSLTLTHFAEVEEVPTSLLRPLASLKKLKIGRFSKLSSLAANESLQVLASLEHLELSSCPKLELFSREGLPSKLKDLRVCSCHNLVSLPKGLKKLQLLHRLEIRDLPHLRSRMELILPNNLLHLTVSGCVALEDWCRREGAPRVQRIHHVEVNFQVLNHHGMQ